MQRNAEQNDGGEARQLRVFSEASDTDGIETNSVAVVSHTRIRVTTGKHAAQIEVNVDRTTRGASRRWRFACLRSWNRKTGLKRNKLLGGFLRFSKLEAILLF